MTGCQIDELCIDWLRDNYGERMAVRYRSNSLVIPMWNPPALNDALEELKVVLSIAFGSGESFGSIDYHQARRRLGLSESLIPIPEVFIKAFAGTV